MEKTLAIFYFGCWIWVVPLLPNPLKQQHNLWQPQLPPHYWTSTMGLCAHRQGSQASIEISFWACFAMHIMHTTQYWYTNREVTSSGLYNKHCSYLPRQAERSSTIHVAGLWFVYSFFSRNAKWHQLRGSVSIVILFHSNPVQVQANQKFIGSSQINWSMDFAYLKIPNVWASVKHYVLIESSCCGSKITCCCWLSSASLSSAVTFTIFQKLQNILSRTGVQVQKAVFSGWSCWQLPYWLPELDNTRTVWARSSRVSEHRRVNTLSCGLL